MSTDTATEHGHDAEHHEHHEHEKGHWTDLQFVYLALALAAVTAIEVWLSYAKDDLGAVFLPALLILMTVKFFSVVFYFMHLKFDNRWFSLLFYMGMVLAIGVYVVALFTFQFFVK
jgi:cytochrome c oxidase subunit 4